MHFLPQPYGQHIFPFEQSLSLQQLSFWIWHVPMIPVVFGHRLTSPTAFWHVLPQPFEHFDLRAQGKKNYKYIDIQYLDFKPTHFNVPKHWLSLKHLITQMPNPVGLGQLPGFWTVLNTA